MLKTTSIDPAVLPKERFAIAFSGGGDSTALVHILRDHRPKPLILIVDHALRAESAEEARKAEAFAKRLGLETQLLTWAHNSPTTGLQAKARQARYGLMGEACRTAGISHLLTAHTRDDQAETLWMRNRRGSDWRGMAGMAETVYAPLWPELVDVTLMRPLLGITRQALRDYNRAHDLSWIDDPSNENRAFTRIQARDDLAEYPEKAETLLKAAKTAREKLSAEKAIFRKIIAETVSIDQYGLITLTAPVPPKLLEHLLRCASGTGGPIDNTKLTHFSESLWSGNISALTLGGTMGLYDKDSVILGPEPSVATGRHNRPAIADRVLQAGRTVLWDGRFRVTAKTRCTLMPFERSNTDDIRPDTHTAFQGTMPAGMTQDGPTNLSVKSLVQDRLVKSLA